MSAASTGRVKTNQRPTNIQINQIIDALLYEPRHKQTKPWLHNQLLCINIKLMEVTEPQKPELATYALAPEEVQKIEHQIKRITNKVYISTYIPSILIICFLMFISVLSTGHAGPALAGLMIGIGISSRWPKSLSDKIIEKKKSTIPGYSDYCDYKHAESRYEYEYKRYVEKLERHRFQKEKEEKRKQYRYWMEIDPWEFENEIALLFERQGYSAKVTKGSGDGGIDILLNKKGRKGVVQCKRYKAKVGPGPVRDLYGTMMAGNYEFGYLACPSGFSDSAYEFSKGKNIKLIGLKRIMEMVVLNA